MIDSTWQAQKPMSGDWKNFHIILQMIPQSHQFQIVVENKESQETFKKIINRDFISLQEQLFRIAFQDPLDLYENLVQFFEKVVIEDQCLKFDYAFGKNKSKRFIIRLQRQMPQVKFQIKKSEQQITEEFQKYKQITSEQIKLLNQKMQKLQKRLEDQILKNQILQRELRQLRQYNNDSKQKIRELEKIIERGNNKLEDAQKKQKYNFEYQKKD